jgi:enoyl-CoA hydratase/carnithine racemase
MSFETIRYDTTGPVATITLDRPERLNTIVPPMRPTRWRRPSSGRPATAT